MAIDQSVFESLRFDKAGLIPAIIQSANDDRVLMMAWMNPEAVRQTMVMGETVFFSRSRQELWHKGATSGNTQRVSCSQVDCDSDALLIKVDENGPACHTDAESCFDVATLFIASSEVDDA